MKKIIFCLTLFCLMAVSINAAQIGIVVDFPDGKLIKNCVDVSDNTDGYAALESANLNMVWSSPGTFGHALCKIEGIGDEVAGTGCAWGATNYWGYYLANNNQWDYMPVGWDSPGGCWDRDVNSFGGHYCAKSGDILGFRYGEFGILPRYFLYDEVCGFGITKVNVEPKKPKPGDKLTVDIDLENDFAFDLKDIKLKVWFEKDGKTLKDDDGDVIEDDSEFDLDAGDDESDLDDEDAAFEFDMPYDVDDGDEYNIYVSLEGKQANDSRIIYRDLDYSKTIKFSREKHEIEIYKFLVNPAEIKCNRNIAFDIGLRNLGEKDEDTTIKISSPQLGIDKTESIKLESGADDNEYKNIYNFNIKDDVPEGDYLVTLKVEYNGGEDYITKIADLKLEDCEKTTETKSETLLQIQPSTEEKTSTERNPITTSVTAKTAPDSYFLIVAILGFIIIIVFGALLVARLLK